MKVEIGVTVVIDGSFISLAPRRPWRTTKW